MQIPDVVGCTPLGGHRIRITFSDGVAGEIDLAVLFRLDGIYAPLADPAFVARVSVDADLGTLAWPGGLDADPLLLYAAAVGKPIDELLAAAHPAAN